MSVSADPKVAVLTVMDTIMGVFICTSQKTASSYVKPRDPEATALMMINLAPGMKSTAGVIITVGN